MEREEMLNQKIASKEMKGKNADSNIIIKLIIPHKWLLKLHSNTLVTTDCKRRCLMIDNNANESFLSKHACQLVFFTQN